MYIITASRKEFNRTGLLDMIFSVFSDEDTNGNNGDDYLLPGAAGYSCTDDYFRSILNECSMDTPESIIVQKAFELYSPTMTSCAKEQDFAYEVDEHGCVTSLSYAYVG